MLVITKPSKGADEVYVMTGDDDKTREVKKWILYVKIYILFLITSKLVRDRLVQFEVL